MGQGTQLKLEQVQLSPRALPQDFHVMLLEVFFWQNNKTEWNLTYDS